MADALKLVPRKKALPPGRIFPSGHGHQRQHWEVNLPAGDTLNDAMDPEYYRLYPRQFLPGARLEVLCEDGSVDADLRVVSLREHSMYTQCLRNGFVSIEGAVAPEQIPVHDDDLGFKVKWSGPVQKHRIIGPDGLVVEHGFDTKEAAEQRMIAIVAERKAALGAA